VGLFLLQQRFVAADDLVNPRRVAGQRKALLAQHVGHAGLVGRHDLELGRGRLQIQDFPRQVIFDRSEQVNDV